MSRALRSLLALLVVFLFVGCDDGDGDASGDDASTSADASATSDTSSGDDTAGGGHDWVADPTTLAECTDGYVHSLPYEILELATDDASVAVRFLRFIGDGTAIGETFPLELGAFAIERDGELDCVRDPAALGYVFGHHNWDERADVTLDDGTTVSLTMRYTFTDTDVVWEDTLSATGSAPLEATPLVARECRSVPSGDLNFCLMRPRVD